MTKKRLGINFFNAFILITILFSQFSIAEISLSSIEQSEAQCCTELNQIEKSIRDNLDKQKKVQEDIKKEKSEEVIEGLKINLETLKRQEKSLEGIFNKMVFGGINPYSFISQEKKDEEFQWQEELLVIVKPLFSEMRSLTAKPRERDRLNYERVEINEKHKALVDGLAALNEIPQDRVSPETKNRIDSLKAQWSAYQRDLISQKNIIDIQLKELEPVSAPIGNRIKNAMNAIFLGRGLTLISAIVAGAAIIMVFSVGAKRLFMKIDRRRGEKRGHKKVKTRLRFLWIIYNLMVYLSAMLAFLSVIYVQGDMVIFGLAVLVLFLVIISLRNYAPQYVSELKIFLNLGAVREGERIMYRGIPWEVKRLGFYCTCVNPALENGRIRISLSEIAALNSRPFNLEEAWFPTKVGDDIFLPNGDYAKVIRQTPEMVSLDVFFKEVMIPSENFYSMQVANVAAGFYATPTFGLDFSHTDLPVTEVATAFDHKVREILTGLGLIQAIRSSSVQLKRIVYGEAIEYTIVLEVEGKNAGSVYRIERAVNHACLEVCQEKGWKLPRQQISRTAIN